MALVLLTLLATMLPATCWGQATEPTRPAQLAFTAAAELQNNRQYDLAAQDWEQFLGQYPADPLTPKARYYAGVCRSQLNEFSRAEAHFRRLLSQYPDFEMAEDAYLSLGWCQYSLGVAGQDKMYSAALATFKRLNEKYPNSRHLDQAHFYAGEAHYARGNRKQAIAHYARLVNRHRNSPLYPNALYALGVAYEEQAQFAEASRVYDRFLLDCQNSDLLHEVRMRKAETVLQAGDVGEAEKQFAAVAAIPGFEAADHALWRQAYCAVQQSEHLRGAELYVSLLGSFPQSEYRTAATLAAARCYYRAKRLDAAVPWLQQTLQSRGPQRVEAAHWLARIYLSQEKPDKALRLAERVLSESDQDSRYLPYLQLDRIDAEAVRRPQDAAAAYFEFARRRPSSELVPQALYNCAFTWMELADYRRAEDVANLFLERYSTHDLFVDVAQIAAESALQLRKYEVAEQRFRRLLESSPAGDDQQAWRIRIALTQYLRKKFESTIRSLESELPRLSKPSEVAEAEFLIGMSHFNLEAFPAAATHLGRSLGATKEWSQSDEALLHLARAEHKQGDHRQAIASIEQLRSSYPKSRLLDQADYYLGEFHFEAEDHGAARAAYRRLIAGREESKLVPHALYGLGWTELKSEDWTAAARAFGELLASFPSHSLASDARLGRGMAYRRSHRFREAIDDLDDYLHLRAQPSGERRADALFERAMAEVGLDDHKSAIETFELIGTEAPQYGQRVNVLYELAWVHKKSGDLSRAAATFEQLIEADPQHPFVAEAYFHIGEERYANGKYDSALEAFRRSSGASPQAEISEQALHKLAWTQFRLKQYQAAADSFGDQLARHPRGNLTADARFMLAECLFKEGDFRAALPAFRAAAEQLPSSTAMQVLVFLHGGQAAAELEQWPVCVNLLSRISADYASSDYLAEALFERGRAYQELKDQRAAVGDFEQAAKLSRGAVGARARFMIGEFHFQQKAFAEAINHYRRVIFGYGGEQADASVRPWQAISAYEAARCEEVRAQQAQDSAAKDKHLMAAISFYRLMLEKDPRHELTEHAQQRLSALTGGTP